MILKQTLYNLLQRDATDADVMNMQKVYTSTVQHTCKCVRTTDLTTTSGAIDTVTWSEEYDIGGMHSTVTNTDRVTIQKDGYYLAIAQLAFDSSGTGVRIVYIRVNGAERASVTLNARASGTHRHQAVYAAPLEAGDYLQVYEYQNSGGNLNIDYTLSFFIVTKLF